MGSYRRGKANSGDLDILISTTDGTSHIGLLGKLLEKLTAQRPGEAGRGERIIAHTLTWEPHGHLYCILPTLQEARILHG